MSGFQLRLPSVIDAFAATAKAAPSVIEPGIYASFQLSADTRRNIMAWAKRVGISNRMTDPRKLHCTTVYSRNPFDFDCLNKCPITARFMHYKVFGDSNSTLVVHLASPFLHKIYAIRRARGMGNNHANYIPHISLGKGFTQEEALSLPMMTFPCLLTHEIYEPLDEGDKAKGPIHAPNENQAAASASERIRVFLIQNERKNLSRDNHAPIRRQHKC